MTTITLGINNCFASKRWPEPDEWARIIAEELGLQIVQFSFDLLEPRTTEPTRALQALRIVNAASKYNLKIHSTFTGLAAYCSNLLSHPDEGMRLDALDWYKNAVKLTDKLNVEGTGGHLGSLSLKDFNVDKRRNFLAKELKQAVHLITQLAKSLDQKFLLWEPMPINRERPSNVTDALHLYEFINDGSDVPILYCLDLGHTCAYDNSGSDLDPYYWIKSLGRLSPVIHLQQTDGNADHHWPFTEEFNQIGIIDANKVVETIHETGMDEVFLLLEIIHPFEARESEVLDDLKETVDYWQEALL